MELLVGAAVVVAIIAVAIKTLLNGFKRQDARMAALFAAIDTVLENRQLARGEDVVPLGANLLLNSRIPSADNAMLNMAKHEYDRLFAEELQYLTAKAEEVEAIREFIEDHNQ